MIRFLRSLDDRRYALVIVTASFLMLVMGNGALFLLAYAMKDIAASFDWPRSIPSTAYSLQFIGGGMGGIVMGWWLDTPGMGRPALLGAIMIGTGAILVSFIDSAWQLFAIYGVVIGFCGNAAMFSPLVANVTRWFTRRRGLAVGLVTSGQSVAGAMWPWVFAWSIEDYGWRDTYFFYGIAGISVMVPLSFLLRRPPPPAVRAARSPSRHHDEGAPILSIRPETLMALLCAAIFGCCVAMSMPLAHIASHATDVGIDATGAASILSILLLGSFVARAFVSGPLIDWLGGPKTLFLFSFLQASTLGILPFLDDYWSMYLVAAIFGFGYGGIAPAYPMIVREYLPEAWAGRCTGIVILFGTFGMAVGGALGGYGYDFTGAYHAPFLLGVGFNIVNLAIVAWLIGATRRPTPLPAAA